MGTEGAIEAGGCVPQGTTDPAVWNLVGVQLFIPVVILPFSFLFPSQDSTGSPSATTAGPTVCTTSQTTSTAGPSVSTADPTTTAGPTTAIAGATTTTAGDRKSVV